MYNFPLIIGSRIKKSAQSFGSKVRSISLILSYIFFASACCLLLTAYCILPSCGKKGPPTLKTSPPPSPSESVDSNNLETTQEKYPLEKEYYLFQENETKE